MVSDIAQDGGSAQAESGAAHKAARPAARPAALRWALDWLYPPRCLACEAPVADPGGLCSDCWRAAVFLAGAVCRRCGALDPYAHQTRPPRRAADDDRRAADEDRRCEDCPPRPVAFTEARAAMAYTGPGRLLPLALKHRDRFDMARAMGGWMARAGADLLRAAPDLGPPVITPAPLHWRRRIARRGDQAAALARAVAAAWDAPLDEGLLRRTRATRPQAGLDAAEARWRNLDRAFVTLEAARARLAGRRIIVVDDVMTTGATLDACAAALLEAGAARVDALVFARPCKAALDALGLVEDADFVRRLARNAARADRPSDHGRARSDGAAISAPRAAVAPGAADATSGRV